MQSNFSTRNGFVVSNEIPITQVHEASYELRGVFKNICYACGLGPKSLRSLVCNVLMKRENEGNWTEYPNIDQEVGQLLDECDWYRFYDLVEEVARKFKTSTSEKAKLFEPKINEYFISNGIGWKIVSGVLEARGPHGFERSIENARRVLAEKSLPTVKSELDEAIKDLSRRPEPDCTGAIQHSMAAIECLVRTISGDEQSTLGNLIKKYPDRIPRPLDDALNKIWGFASENARHIKEGQVVSSEEAELVVGVVASMCTYLGKRITVATNNLGIES
jgi:AbiJ N-terminal domain 4